MEHIAATIEYDGSIQGSVALDNTSATGIAVTHVSSGIYEITLLSGEQEYLVGVNELKVQATASSSGALVTCGWEVYGHDDDPDNARVRIRTFKNGVADNVTFSVFIARG